MNSVRVLVAKSLIHRLPLASTAMAKGSTRPASNPRPAAGESTVPGAAVFEAPASSVRAELKPGGLR